MQAAAQARGIKLLIHKARTEPEINAAFATLASQQADALLVGSDPVFYGLRQQLVMLASRYAIPAIYELREFVEIGGLASYGPRLMDIIRETGIYAGRILNGENPGDLPVQQPTKFELVINLKTAKALGIIVPPSMLVLADDVIE